MGWCQVAVRLAVGLTGQSICDFIIPLIGDSEACFVFDGEQKACVDCRPRSGVLSMESDRFFS